MELELSDESAPTSSGFVRRAGTFLLREFRQILPPTIFFFIGFNLIWLTTNLLIAQYDVSFASFMLTTAAVL